MKLLQANLGDPFWAQKDYILPQYDRQAVAERTRQSPQWLHLGAGNIFRAFLAQAQQEMLNAGKADTGIIVAEGFDAEIIQKAYRDFDDLCISVVLKSDGSIEKHVVGSVTESLVMQPGGDDWARLVEVMTAPSLQMVSFTITEKGYNIQDADTAYFPDVRADFEKGPAAPVTYIGKVAALCYERYKAGRLPVALVSMDNCSHNGDRLYAAISDYARHWCQNGQTEQGFCDYIDDRARVTFPWSAIDKITPRPDTTVQRQLVDDGVENVVPVQTAKNTFVAPFVNAEQTQYLVVEDAFPNGRPVLQAEGVYFAERETVDKFEKMKVCTCLNPLHTCLAIYGCLLGYTSIAQEMQDPQLRTLVERIAYQEAMPVVVNPGIIDPAEFVDKVLNERFPNPFIPDTPQRIATDTSQKLAIRFGETIKAYLASDELDVHSLRYIPFVLAGWCRYLLAVDDEGQPFELSPDPMLETVQQYTASIRLGDTGDFHTRLQPILSNAKIFGVDLYEAGLGDIVESDFARLVAGKGAVRTVLTETVAGDAR